MATKKCGRCKAVLDLSLFCKHKQTNDGLEGTCTSCRKKDYWTKRKIGDLIKTPKEIWNVSPIYDARYMASSVDLVTLTSVKRCCNGETKEYKE